MIKLSKGFTLMELMIVVVIISTLVAIAIPAYNNYDLKARRAAAKTALTGFSAAMESWYAQAHTYQGAAVGGANTGSPAIYEQVVPKDATGTRVFYNLNISTSSVSGYTLQAVRTNRMASDACGDFTLNNLGTKGLANNTKSIADCW